MFKIGMGSKKYFVYAELNHIAGCNNIDIKITEDSSEASNNHIIGFVLANTIDEAKDMIYIRDMIGWKTRF